MATSKTRLVVRELGVLLFFAALAAFALRPVLEDPSGSTLVGPDPLIDLWTVDWLSGHLLSPGSLYGGNIFQPVPHAVVYSDLSLGTAVLVAPLRALVKDPVPLYNLSLGIALAFGGWSFALLARRLTGSLPAGLLAGTLAAFSSHQLSHIYHLNLLTIGWLALLVVGLEACRSGTPGAGTLLLLAASAVLSAESSGYYAVGAALLALLFALVHARDLLEGRRLAIALGALVLALLLFVPYFRAYEGAVVRDALRRPLGMSEHMAWHPLADLSSVSYVDRAVFGSSGERLFPGFLTLLLAGLALLRKAPRIALPLAAVGLFYVLALGPRLALGGLSLPLPYRALFALPGLGAMRHPYTFAAIGGFFLALLAGAGLATLGSRPLLQAALVAVAVLETAAPPPRVGPLPPGVPKIYDLAFSKGEGIVLEIPPFAPETLLFAARHQKPVANGAGAFAPKESLLLERYVQNHWLAGLPKAIDDSPPRDAIVEGGTIHTLIVPCGRKPALRALARALDASRTFVLLGEAPDGDRAYAVRAGSADPGEARKEP
jgi:hypothetical protein